MDFDQVAQTFSNPDESTASEDKKKYFHPFYVEVSDIDWHKIPQEVKTLDNVNPHLICLNANS